MNTTLNAIRAYGPCGDGWKKLLANLGKTTADSEPLSIVTVLDSNGLDDALWCLRAVSGHDREIRLYAIWCARQVRHLMTDPRSLRALDIADAYANGQATQIQLSAAAADAGDAAGAAEEAAAAAAVAGAGEAAGVAARAASRAVAWNAAGAAARAAAGAEAWLSVRAAAWDDARDGAEAAAEASQAAELREICSQ